jgi:hypothetical protein
MNHPTAIFVTLFSILGLAFVAFFMFKLWLNRDIRVILNALHAARGTTIAVDDEEAQHSHAKSSQKRKGIGKGWEPKGDTNGQSNGGKKNKGKGKRKNAPFASANVDAIEMTPIAPHAKGNKESKGKDEITKWAQKNAIHSSSKKSGGGQTDNIGTDEMVGQIGEWQTYGDQGAKAGKGKKILNI